MTSDKLIESTIIQEQEPGRDPLDDMLGPEGHDEFEWRAEFDPADALWTARGPFAHIWGFGPERTRGLGGAVSKDTQRD